MKARIWLAATVLGGLLSPAAWGAEGIDGRFMVAFQGGTQSEISGDLIKGTTATVFDKAMTIDSQRYRDVYAPDLRLQGVLGYGIAPKVEVIARGSWYKANATTLQVGSMEDKPVYAVFDENGDYEEVGVEVGFRYYLAAAGRMKSYVGAVGGARWLSATYLSISVPDAGSAVQNVPFQEKGTVPVFGLDLGFSFDLGQHFFVGMDTGLRYQGAPPQANALPALAAIDDSDSRWSAPVTVTVGLRF
jgi:hypothetical protein